LPGALAKHPANEHALPRRRSVEGRSSPSRGNRRGNKPSAHERLFVSLSHEFRRLDTRCLPASP
jgi:hypothetical protein